MNAQQVLRVDFSLVNSSQSWRGSRTAARPAFHARSCSDRSLARDPRRANRYASVRISPSAPPPRPDWLALRGPARRLLPAAPGGSLPAVLAYCRPMPGALCAARLASSPRERLLSGVGDEQPLARSPAAPSPAMRPGQSSLSFPREAKVKSDSRKRRWLTGFAVSSTHERGAGSGGAENCAKAARAEHTTARKSPRGAGEKRDFDSAPALAFALLCSASCPPQIASGKPLSPPTPRPRGPATRAAVGGGSSLPLAGQRAAAAAASAV